MKLKCISISCLPVSGAFRWPIFLQSKLELPLWGCQQVHLWPWGWCTAAAADHTGTWTSDSWLSLRESWLETPWLAPAENSRIMCCNWRKKIPPQLSAFLMKQLLLPATWGGGWWPSAQTSRNYHLPPQTKASSSGCRSPPWRNSDWSCCSLAGWAVTASSPPPRYLHSQGHGLHHWVSVI